MGVPLPLLEPLRPTDSPKPSWLKVRAPGGPQYLRLKSLMKEWNLHSVCEEARCPNIGECWEDLTATFMILGDICTRNCGYCAVRHGRPAWEWLLVQANGMGLRGGSAFRAMAGFGRHHQLQENHFFELAGTLTIEVEFVVSQPNTEADSDERPTASVDLDDASTSRTTLRLPDALKARVDEAAAADGLSVNTWLVRAVAAALQPKQRRSAQRTLRTGDNFVGWAR